MNEYEISNIRSINDPKKSLGDIVKQINLAWCFDNWFEKLFLVTCVILAGIKVFEWVF